MNSLISRLTIKIKLCSKKIWDALVSAWKVKGIYRQGNPIVAEGMVVTARGAEKGALYTETGKPEI